MKKHRLTVTIMLATIVLSNTNINSMYNNYSRYNCHHRCSSGIGAGEALLIAGGIAAISAISYFLAKWAGNVMYDKALQQYKIVAQFQNSHGRYTDKYRYNELKKIARNLYYDQSYPSSTSLSNDYPVVWLEKSATSTKNFLALMILSTRMRELSNKMQGPLNYLRNFEQFIVERRAYNEKFREQSYRDDRINLEKEKIEIEREKLNHRKEQDARL